MNYAETSDFEINCAVARGMGFEGMVFFDVDSSICSGPVWNVASGVTDDSIRVSRGNAFNPCSSWADAGPIIEQHGISMLFNFDVPFCYKPERDSHGVPFTRFKYQDANPLRAAMIVFLMMQEQSNA